jgi:HPt (histidine-containing phosphotransfer) domain-containing protein
MARKRRAAAGGGSVELEKRNDSLREARAEMLGGERGDGRLPEPADGKPPGPVAQPATAPAGPPATASRLMGASLLPPAVLADLLAEFLAELPGRAQQIEAAYQRQAPKELAHCAHQLKGAASIYGLPEIANCAKVLYDAAVDAADWPQIESAVAELNRLCRRAVEQGVTAVDGEVSEAG